MTFVIDPYIRLSTKATVLNFEQKFPYAVYYLSGWVKNSETFEVYYNSNASDNMLTNMFGGAKIPSRIQFRAVSSTIEVVAMYAEGFKVKLNFDLFELGIGAHNIRECLLRNCYVSFSPEAEGMEEMAKEATVGLLSELMISYWIGEAGTAVA